MKKILVLEDDITMNKMISDILLMEGYQINSAFNREKAQLYLKNTVYDMAILDINLPDGSGYDVCCTIREKAQTAVLFLTANDLERDIIKGYELGAADYITKPFSNCVLRHKVRAIFELLENTVHENVHKIYDDGKLIIDFSSMNAALNGSDITFTPLEYRMLKVFTENNGIVLTRQRLIDILWDRQENYVDEHTLTATVSRIRGKLEKNGQKYIQTIYGMGYMFHND